MYCNTKCTQEKLLNFLSHNLISSISCNTQHKVLHAFRLCFRIRYFYVVYISPFVSIYIHVFHSNFISTSILFVHFIDIHCIDLYQSQLAQQFELCALMCVKSTTLFSASNIVVAFFHGFRKQIHTHTNTLTLT